MKERNMKLNKFANLLVIGLVMCLAATGCKKKPVGVTNLPPGSTPKPADAGPGGAYKPGTEGTDAKPMGTDNPLPDAGQFDKYTQDAEIFKAYTVYFDFDSSVLKASEKPKMASVADHLKANPTCAVRVTGNCDERGTEEYNRSLGERRALAAREELIRLGVNPKMIDTISYGKDRPAVVGHDEAAWSKNRRDEFILLTPPK
jgi:peptidoglycan-associated lipoprotein